jgi:ankyrin repeat protein
MNQFYDSCLKARLAGTCQWVLATLAFREWSTVRPDDDTPRLLWINGPAGFGKTVLAASLTQHLTKLAPLDPIAYFFFSAAAEARDDPLAIIRTWTSQLVSLNDIAFKLALEQSDEKVASIASESQVWSIFASIADNISPCTFVLDGLDECVKAGDRRADFLSQLKRSVAHTASRLLIVSRDEPDIRSELCAASPAAADGGDSNGNIMAMYDAPSPACLMTSRLPSQQLQPPPPGGICLTELSISEADVHDDVARFSRSIVDRKLPNKDAELRQTLAADMARKSAGMFLWIDMQKERLRPGKNPKQLQKAVQQMPAGLARAYERNWTEILQQDASDQRRALAILRWATFALRPLTVREIADALVVTVDDSDDDDDVDDDNDDSDDNGDKTGDDFAVDELPDKLDKYYVDDQIVDVCRALVVVRGASVPPASQTVSSEAAPPLAHATIHLAHFSVREFLLASAPPLHLSGINNVPFSDPAAHNNHLAMLCLQYLQYKKTWTDHDGATGIRPFVDYAARQWHQHLRRDHGGYSKALALVHQFFGQKSQKWTTWRDYVGETATDEPESQVPDAALPSGPLYYAALYGLIETIDFLLAEDGADVNAVGGIYGTALQVASAKGHHEVVNRLICQDADLDLRAGKFGCALNAAAGEGHESTVRSLMDAGAKLNITDLKDCCALYLGTLRRRLRLWLGKVANIAETDYGEWTPLNCAADAGHIAVVKLLIDRGADMCMLSRDGWTPLNSAASKGHIEVVKFLLERGADMSLPSSDGWTPLQSAASEGHFEVVQLLLDRGADMSVPNSDGWTPLNCAANGGHFEVVRLLLDRGADMSAPNSIGWTPLNSAADKGHVEVVKLLLDRGADVSPASAKVWTPVHLAARNGHVEAVRLLLVRGAPLAVANDRGQTPLYLAAENGHVDIIKILLDHGADKTAASCDGRQPLDIAAQVGHVEVVRLLVDDEAVQPVFRGENST